MTKDNTRQDLREHSKDSGEEAGVLVCSWVCEGVAYLQLPQPVSQLLIEGRLAPPFPGIRLKGCDLQPAATLSTLLISPSCCPEGSARIRHAYKSYACKSGGDVLQ